MVEEQSHLTLETRNVEVIVHQHNDVHDVGFRLGGHERAEDDKPRQITVEAAKS